MLQILSDIICCCKWRKFEKMKIDDLINEKKIYQRLEEKLKSFMANWPLFCNNISVKISDAEQLYRNDVYSLTLKGYDKINNTIFLLSVSCLNQAGCYDNISVRLTIDPKSLLLLDNDIFSPDEMYTSFWTMAVSLFNLEVHDDSVSDVKLSFSNNLDIEDIYIMVRNTNTAINTLAFAHRIYEHNDAYFLSSMNSNNITNLKNLRNFYFIWQRTNISEILIPHQFEKSFFLYIEDVERYNALIAMTKI